jgi:hypothetical protein
VIASFLLALSERLEGDDAATARRGGGSVKEDATKVVGDAVKGEVRRLGGEAVT